MKTLTFLLAVTFVVNLDEIISFNNNPSDERHGKIESRRKKELNM